jgi:hypothetical protein
MTRARERGVDLIVQRVESGEMKGWTSARYSDRQGPSAWFKELPSECAC